MWVLGIVEVWREMGRGPRGSVRGYGFVSEDIPRVWRLEPLSRLRQ